MGLEQFNTDDWVSVDTTQNSDLSQFDTEDWVSVSSEPQEEVKKPGLIASVGKGLAHGTLGLAEDVGIGLEYLGNRVGSETLQDVGKTTSDYWGDKAEKFQLPDSMTGNIVDNPKLLLNAQWWLYNVSDMVPALATSMIPGNAVYKGLTVAKVAPKLAKLAASAAGGLTGGALEGAQTYKAVLEKGGSEEEAARAAELMTAGAGVLNALSVGSMLPKAAKTFKQKVIKHLGAGAWEGITEGAEEPTEVFSKYFAKYLADEPIPDNLGVQLKESLKDALTVAPIAALTGIGGSVMEGNEQEPREPSPIDTDNPEQGLKNQLNLATIQQYYKAGQLKKADLERIKELDPALTGDINFIIDSMETAKAPVEPEPVKEEVQVEEPVKEEIAPVEMPVAEQVQEEPKAEEKKPYEIIEPDADVSIENLSKTEDPKFFRGSSNTDALIHLSTKDGKWQVTSFDKKGTPNGDTQFNKYSDAVEEALSLTSIMPTEWIEAEKDLESTKTPSETPLEPTQNQPESTGKEEVKEPTKAKLESDGVELTPEQFQLELYATKNALAISNVAKSKAPHGKRDLEIQTVKNYREKLQKLQSTWNNWQNQNKDEAEAYQKRQSELADLKVGDIVDVHHYGELVVTKVNDKTVRVKRASDGYELEDAIPKISIKIVSKAQKPLTKKQQNEEAVKPAETKQTIGTVRLDKGGVKPFRTWKEIQKGSKKGWIKLNLVSGKTVVVKKEQIRSWPEEVVNERKKTVEQEKKTSYSGEGYTVEQVKSTDTDKGTKWKITFEESRKPILKAMSKEVAQGEPGKRMPDAEGKWFGVSSTFPEWFKNQGWGKAETIKAINKAIAGEPLGIRQARIIEAALEEIAKVEYDNLKSNLEEKYEDSTGEIKRAEEEGIQSANDDFKETVSGEVGQKTADEIINDDFFENARKEWARELEAEKSTEEKPFTLTGDEEKPKEPETKGISKPDLDNFKDIPKMVKPDDVKTLLGRAFNKGIDTLTRKEQHDLFKTLFSDYNDTKHQTYLSYWKAKVESPKEQGSLFKTPEKPFELETTAPVSKAEEKRWAEMQGKEEKEPWEMTEDEYSDFISDKRNAAAPEYVKVGLYYKSQYVDESQSKISRYDKAKSLENPDKDIPELGKTYYDTILKTEKWLNEHSQYDPFNNAQNHKDIIEQALSEGKPVPESVLKDYPELQKGNEVPVEDIYTSINKAISENPIAPITKYENQIAESKNTTIVIPQGARLSLENYLIESVENKKGPFSDKVTQVGEDRIGKCIFDIDRPYGTLRYIEETGELTVTRKSLTSEMAVKSTKFGVDKTLLLQTISKDIVNNDLGGTIANETIQNALDAFDSKQKDKTITIEIDDRVWDTSPDGKTETIITITDNGKGMSANEVEKNLLRLGAKGKTGTTSRGGYGLAKAAFLLTPRRAEIITVKDGVKTILKGTKEQFFGVKGSGDPTIETVSTGEPSGTTFKLSFYAYEADAKEDNSFELSGSEAKGAFIRYVEKGVLTPDITIKMREHKYADFTTTVTKSPESLDQIYRKESFEIAGSRLTIYYVPNDRHTYRNWRGKFMPPVETFNKGLALFGIGGDAYNVNDFEEEPQFKAIVNFEKTPDVRERDYPFLRNRTQLNEEIRQEVQKRLNDKIDKINQQEFDVKKTAFSAMIANSPIVNGVKVMIPFTDKEEFNKAKKLIEDNQEVISDFGEILKSFQILLNKVGGKQLNLVMTVDPKVHGWRSNPEVTGHEFYAINPFAITNDFELSPEFQSLLGLELDANSVMAANLSHTLVHEYTHDQVQDHQERYTLQLANNYAKIGHIQLGRLDRQGMEFYGKNINILRSLQNDFGSMGQSGSQFRKDNLSVYSQRLDFRRAEDLRRVQETGEGTESQVDYLKTSPLNPDDLSSGILNSMNRTLKAKGYDVRGSKDILNLIKKGNVFRDGVFTLLDWQDAYDKALGTQEKRQATQAKKQEFKNINWQRLKELGKTTNIKEAGYITPEGEYLDFSGKKEGGTPGERAYDHREAGGTAGMQELMAYGYIRMDDHSGSIDISKVPTAAQYNKIRLLAERHNGEITLDLEDGLGEYSEGNGYYSRSERVFSSEYPKGTNPQKIINDIKKFFSGEIPVQTLAQRFNFLLAGQSAKRNEELGPLNDAMEMESSGKTKAEIWDKTGWIKGVDGEWRFEIDDKRAKFDSSKWLKTGETKTMRQGMKLGEIFKHPELYTYYPFMKNIQVFVSVSPSNETISGSYRQWENSISVSAPTVKEAKECLLHEIQHVIQHYHGFAMGGSLESKGPQKVGTKDNAILDAIVEQGKIFDKAPEGFKSLVRIINQELVHKKNTGGYSDEAKFYDTLDKVEKEYGDLYDQYVNAQQKVYNLGKENRPMTDSEYYRQLAGEAEAREVAKRAKMSASERAKNVPGYDGIPEQDLIIRRDYIGNSRYMNIPTAGRPLSKLMVEKFAKRIKMKIPNIGNIKVLQSQSEISQYDNNYQDRGKVYAFYDLQTDTTYIVADSMTSPEMVYGTILHETIGHRGIYAVLSKMEQRAIFKQVKVAYQNTDIGKKIIRDYNLDLTKERDQIIFGKELIAHMAQKNENASILDKIVAWIKRAIRRAGIALKISDAEIKVLLAKSYEYSMRGAGRVQGEGQPMYQVEAYHGSPYVFDRFSTEKIGTGEGAQAFGYGLYFTDKESIAKGYADAGSLKSTMEINGRALKRDPLGNLTTPIKELNKKEADIIRALIKNDYGLNDSDLRYLVDTIHDSIYEGHEQDIENDINEEVLKGQLPKEALLIVKENKFKVARNLYKVTLHKGKTPDQYTWLDWNEKPSKTIIAKLIKEIEAETTETNEIKKLKSDLKKIDEWFYQGVNKVGQKEWDIKSEQAGDIRKSLFDLTGDAYGQSKLQTLADTLSFNDLDGSEIYHKLVSTIKSQRDASLFLLRAGIDGIRYPSGTLSGIKDSGASNYVVFDENAVTIDERISYMREETSSDAFKKWFKNSKVVDENGEPLVVYHGTNKEFSEFNYQDKQSNPYLFDDNHLGFFFDARSGRPSDWGEWTGASGFAGVYQKDGETKARQGANIIPVYLSMQNPKYYGFSEYIEALNKAGSGEALKGELIKEGHDGIIRHQKLKDSSPLHYIVFSPSQIKSIYNQGTWNPEDDRISYSRESVADAWLDDLLNETPAVKKEKAEIKKAEGDISTLQILKDIWDKEKNILTLKGSKANFSILDSLLGTPLHYFKKVAAARREFDEANKKNDTLEDVRNSILLDPTGKTFETTIMDKARKYDPEGYKKMGETLVEDDKNQYGYRVAFKDGVYNVYAPGEFKYNSVFSKRSDAVTHMEKYAKQTDFPIELVRYVWNKKIKKWEVYLPKSVAPVASFQTEDLAWENADLRAAEDLKTRINASDVVVKAFQAFKRIAARVYKIETQTLKDLQKWYTDRGLEAPVDSVTINGETIKVDLRLALAMMGDRRGYYFPRNRNQGKFMIVAEQEGLVPELHFFDLALEENENNPSRIRKAFNASTPLLRMKRALLAKGFTEENIKIERSDRLPEDVFVQDINRILNLQTEINAALQSIDTEPINLEKFGIRFIDRKIPVQGGRARDFAITGPLNSDQIKIIKEMGGHWFSPIKGEPKMYHFVNPGRNFQKRLAKALITVSHKVDQESMTMLTKAFVERITEIERGRGARQHMIPRNNRRGDNVFIGYETDPIKAASVYAAGIAGSQAKKIMAGNMIRIFNGTDISFKQFGLIYGYEGTFEQYETEMRAIKSFEGGFAEYQAANPNTKITNEDDFYDFKDTDDRDLDKEDFETYNNPQAFKDNKARIEELKQIENRTQEEDDELSDAITHVYDTYRKSVEDRRIDAKKQGQAWKDVKSYISNMLQNEEAADRIMGVIKGAAVFKYLGFRVSSMAVNATNMATAIPAAMSVTAGIPMHKAPRLLAIAANKYTRYKLGKSYQAMEGLNPTVTEDEKWALDEIIKKKWDGAKFNREALAALENKWGRRWSNIVEFSMIGFGAVESVNRGATILAAYNGIRESNPGMTREDALKLAKKVSDEGNSVYNKANWPTWTRGTGIGPNIARSAYLFGSYSHNYLQLMKAAHGPGIFHAPKNIAALGWLTVAPAILGGTGAMIGKEVIFALLKQFGIGGDDPEEEFYGWIGDIFGDYGEQISRYGLAGALGVNIKSSLSIGNNVSTDLTDITLIDILGAPAEMLFTQPVQMVTAIKAGDYMKAGEQLLPLAAGNVIKGVREKTRGVTSWTNSPVYYGNEQITANTADMIKRFLSFSPAGMAMKREKQYAETKIEQAYEDEKSRIYSKVRAYYNKSEPRDRAEYENILEDIREYNESLKSSSVLNKVYITRKSIKTMMKRAYKPSKKERIRASQE